MDEEGRSRGRAGRRPKRFLTPMQEYETCLQVIRNEVAMTEVAVAAGADRTTVARIRQVADDGARSALTESRPGIKRLAARTSNWTRRKRKSLGYRNGQEKWP